MVYLSNCEVSIIEKVIRYKCSDCGDLFYAEEECLEHEDRHKRINAANEMLKTGCTLQEIQDMCHIWHSIPEHLKDVNKDNCFKIPHWQCCEKPAYQIHGVFMDGRISVGGCGSWSGWYGSSLSLDDSNLRCVFSKEELFVDSRY